MTPTKPQANSQNVIELVTNLFVYRRTSMWRCLRAAASRFPGSGPPCGTADRPSAGPEILAPDAGWSLSDERLSRVHWPDRSPARSRLWSASIPVPETCTPLCQLKQTRSILNRPVFTYTHENILYIPDSISVTKECSQWDYINAEMQSLPSVFCMIRSTRMGYFVMRWVTNIKHSGIPNLRTRASWPIFCYKREVLFSKTCIIPAILLSAVNAGLVYFLVNGIIPCWNIISVS